MNSENRITFDWKQLDGKTLYMKTETSVDDLAKEMITVVMGQDVNTGHQYVVHIGVKRL
jgi:hypothetical protein